VEIDLYTIYMGNTPWSTAINNSRPRDKQLVRRQQSINYRLHVNTSINDTRMRGNCFSISAIQASKDVEMCRHVCGRPSNERLCELHDRPPTTVEQVC